MSTVSYLTNIEEILKEATMLNLVKALIIGIVGLILIRLINRSLEEWFRTKGEDYPYKDIILRVIKVILFTFWVLVVATQLGFETSSVLIVFAVFTLVSLYAVEDIIANIAGGIVIKYSKTFKKGDLISVGGKEGIVKEMLPNCTKLETVTGEMVTVPNKSISTATVVNYSALGMRCVVLKIMASYQDDPQRVIAACTEMMENTENVLRSKPCRVYLAEYGENNIRYDLYFWVDAGNYMQMKYAMNAKIYETFRQKGIRISAPRIRIEGAEEITAGEITAGEITMEGREG